MSLTEINNEMAPVSWLGATLICHMTIIFTLLSTGSWDVKWHVICLSCLHAKRWQLSQDGYQPQWRLSRGLPRQSRRPEGLPAAVSAATPGGAAEQPVWRWRLPLSKGKHSPPRVTYSLLCLPWLGPWKALLDGTRNSQLGVGAKVSPSPLSCRSGTRYEEL